MAVQTHPFLQITDGTTPCTIQDGSGGATNYPLVRRGWAPAIAGLRASPLAGQTPYDDVDEQMTIEVHGSTAANALANLATLMKLLEQAARWYRGENETAVLVKFAPHGSTVSSTAAPLQAAILGGAAGPSDPGLRLTPEWDEVGRNYVIRNVVVSFTRRGLWLHTTIETPSTNAGNNGELVTTTFSGALGTPGPTEIWASNFQFGYDSSFRAIGGFLLAGEPVGGSAPIAIANAESATATGFTSVAGGMNARNTNVLRYTPTGTSESPSGFITPTLPSTTNLVAVFANVFPSTTVNFTMRLYDLTDVDFAYSPVVSIPAQSAFENYPYWVFLGLVPLAGTFTFQLLVAASAASSRLDIDTVVVCDARATQIIGLGGVTTVRTYTSDVLKVDHNLLDALSPTATVDGHVITCRGDAVFMTKSATVYTLLLATGGGTGSSGQEFRQANTSTDAVLSNTWTLKRTPSYLVPQ